MEELFKKLADVLGYLKTNEIKSIQDAYLFATKAHSGQKRYTGHDYITHPVEVAYILAKMHLDAPTITAALLHDTIEDTLIDKTTLSKKFGRQVAELVDSVSKLEQIEFKSRKEAQAENFRKMLLAMSKDIRVILIKLADRLHNIRTLETLPTEKRCRIARETLEIYAPITKRLGMRELSIELEDQSFKCLYPYRYRILEKSIFRVQGTRKSILREINQALKKKLNKAGIKNYKLQGRQKHLYSIYKKMRDKNIPFSEITDVYAVRIIVENIDQCYQVLGLTHHLYTPVPERFKDYIALPKNNGYQSLHTVLFGPHGVPIEIQIRTFDMDELANNGIAAHWLYKSGTKNLTESQIRSQQWMRNLLDIQKSTKGNSKEFIENVTIDLFPNEVYVFTPKKGIFELPKGATAIDFAYAVHTDVGNTCSQARIDRQLKPISTPLLNGQTIEIITSPHARPTPEWLQIAITGKALSNIRYYLKHQKRQQSIVLGQKLLVSALKYFNLSLKRIPDFAIQSILQETSTANMDDLFEAIGLGNHAPILTASRITKAMKQKSQPNETGYKLPCPDKMTPLIISGTEGMVVHLANCCHPIPGDPISAIIKSGHGILIHLEQCKELNKLQQRLPDKCISVRWSKNIKTDFLVPINVEVIDQHGILALLTKAVSDAKAGIDDISVIHRDGDIWAVRLVLTVKDRPHLANIFRIIRQLHFVTHLARSDS